MILGRKEKKAEREVGQGTTGGKEPRNLMQDFKLCTVLSSMLPMSSVPKTPVNCYSLNLGSIVLWGVMGSEQHPVRLQWDDVYDRREEIDNAIEPRNQKRGRNVHGPLTGQGLRIVLLKH